MSIQPVSPGRAWYLLPVFMFLVMTVLVPVGFVAYVLNQQGFQGVQFAVPGSREFSINKPGSYVLWDEVETFYEGTNFAARGDIPPGVQYELKELSGEKIIPMAPNTGFTTRTTTMSLTTARRSVGTFQIAEPGKYELSVTGNFPKRIFYFRDSMLARAPLVVLAAGIGVLGFIGSVAMAVLIFLKRASVRRQTAR